MTANYWKQCGYYDQSHSHIGKRCRRIARWKMYPANGEGSVLVCREHRAEISRRSNLIARAIDDDADRPLSAKGGR